MAPDRIVSLYTGRWSIEVTFQEVRVHLAFPRAELVGQKRAADSALSAWDCSGVVSLIFHRHTRGKGTRPASFAWYAKTEPTFSDAMTCVRRLCWAEVFQQSAQTCGCQKNYPRHYAACCLAPAVAPTPHDAEKTAKVG